MKKINKMFRIFIGYSCVFTGKINAIHILINEELNREILGFFKMSRDTSRTKIEPVSRELNYSFHTEHFSIAYVIFIYTYTHPTKVEELSENLAARTMSIN